MDRKNFIKKGLVGIAALPATLAACAKETSPDNTGCNKSPVETAGPFPTIDPDSLEIANITSDRTGISLVITLTILDKSNECNPLVDAYVDIWHCDKDGDYSEYGANAGDHFLRGRQITGDNGRVSFQTIFPGWYPGRAPHIHVEVLDSNENSLLITQIAFPKNTCDTVYATSGYHGTADTTNTGDGVFANSLEGNIANLVTGNIVDGYTLLKTIVV